MLSKSTEYAIRALVFIQLRSWEDKRPGVLQIANEIDAPGAFTAKILQILTKQNLVNSMKGRGGGFFIEREQPEVTLYDVIRVMEGEGLFQNCCIGLKNCSDIHPCPIHDKFKNGRDGFTQIVRKESISSLSRKILNGEAVLKRTNNLI